MPGFFKKDAPKTPSISPTDVADVLFSPIQTLDEALAHMEERLPSEKISEARSVLSACLSDVREVLELEQETALRI